MEQSLIYLLTQDDQNLNEDIQIFNFRVKFNQINEFGISKSEMTQVFKRLVVLSLYKVKFRFLLYITDALYDYLDLQDLEKSKINLKKVLGPINKEFDIFLDRSRDLVTNKVVVVFQKLFDLDCEYFYVIRKIDLLKGKQQLESKELTLQDVISLYDQRQK